MTHPNREADARVAMKKRAKCRHEKRLAAHQTDELAMVQRCADCGAWRALAITWSRWRMPKKAGRK